MNRSPSSCGDCKPHRSWPTKEASSLISVSLLLLVSSSSNICSAFLTSAPAARRTSTNPGTAGVRCRQPPRGQRVTTRMGALGRDGGEGLRGGLAKQEFKTMLDEGSTKGCLKLIKRSGNNLELGMEEGSKLLTLVSNDVLQKNKPDEEDIIETYSALKAAGLLKAFGSIDLNVVPSKTRTMSPERLMQLTGMEVKNLAPGRPTGSWLIAGVGLFGAEYLAGEMLGLDPLQTVIPLTLGLVAADKVLAGGAIAESCIRAIVPGYREKIVRHEAGHFLLAYLLGCPVQGCLLDPFTVGKYARAGAQGGTVFADPIFAKGIASGKLTRSAIDRFSIVLMGGIAAEAIEYGSSEGGSADEGVMIEILSTISPPFSVEQIKAQALWAATQAVLLINEHKEAYETLVAALDRGADLGECVSVLEAELRKKPLPGDLRRQDVKVISPAEEVKAMIIRRMSQRYWSNHQERITAMDKKVQGEVRNIMADTAGEQEGSLSSQMADNDKAMLELQRRVEELERTTAAGNSFEGTGLTGDSGGVWMNDLKALREDIVATNNKNKAISDAALSGESEAVKEAQTEVTPLASSSTAALRSPSTSKPKPVSKNEDQLKDIETKTAENAKRMEEVEARLRKFEEERV